MPLLNTRRLSLESIRKDLSAFRHITSHRSLVAAGGAILAAVCGGGAALLAYAVRVEPNWIEVRRVTVPLPRLAPEFHGYKLVQISDIHAGRWMPYTRLARIVNLINREEADMIAVTGDFVTRAYKEATVDLVPVLSRLRAKDGVVGVLGNHDYWGRRGPGLVREVIARSGMIDINNRVLTLLREGAAFHIAGLDSVRVGAHRLDLALAALPERGAALLVIHEPDFADVSAATRRFDMQISGHSHGGQVTAPLWGPIRLPILGRKYPAGRYTVEGMELYTNRGLGMVGFPVRFLCRPEITVFTLDSADA